MKKQRGRAIARNILKLLLSAIAVFWAGWLLIDVVDEPGIAYDAENTAQTSIASITSGKTFTDTDKRVMPAIAQEMVASFAEVKAYNEDTSGWLLIPNICYYPIMYSEVYDYYLTHNPQRDASAQGSIFINYQCEPSFDNILTLIHGHNMRDTTMFGRLSEYLGEDFFRNNNPIIIYDGESMRTYKPFIAVILEENNDVIDARELSDTERTSYIESMYERSISKMEEGEDPDLTKPVIFFSTCDYSFSEARLLVGAYLTGIEEVSR